MKNEKIIKQWCWEHSYCDADNEFVTKLRREGFTAKQIAKIVTAIDGTCKDCWDADAGCQCWNDE